MKINIYMKEMIFINPDEIFKKNKQNKIFEFQRILMFLYKIMIKSLK